MRNSLTYRLITTSFVWVGAALLVTAVLLVFLFRGHIEKHFNGSLQDHLEELVAASDMTPAGLLQMTWRPTDPRFNRPHSGWYWEIQQSGVSVARSDSLWRDSLDVAEPDIDDIARLQQLAGPEAEPLQALVQDIRFPQSKHPLLFVVAGPVSEIEENVRAFTIQVAITLAVLGIGLLLAVWFQVRFGLQPLQALQQALGDIRRAKTQRLPQSFPQEVQPVVNELNELLDHNAVLLERARTQAGNLAHALKNPLTVVRNETKTIEGSQGDIIRKQMDAMTASMDRYLSRARMAGASGVLGARAGVQATVEDLCYYMERLYRERDIEISHRLPPDCWFRGEAQDLEEMLGNLIDNACKWALSKVRITAECAGERLVIFVDDDGDGIPETLRQDVLKRGRRLDEKMPGSGLGLDIVRDIAELYRGSLELEQSELGGVGARLDLPAVGDLR
jgi:signal transduction histidine kinase